MISDSHWSFTIFCAEKNKNVHCPKSCGVYKAGKERFTSMTEEKYVAYVGTYTHENSVGIHIYDVDVPNGYMKERKVVPINNPSDLVVSKNRKFLYSIADEGVEAFKILKDGDLEQAVTRIIAQLEERDQIRQKEEEETPVVHVSLSPVSFFSLLSRRGEESVIE